MDTVFTGIDERTRHAAGDRASGYTNGGRRQPACRHHRAEAWNGDQAEAGQQACRPADRTAHAGTLCGIGHFVDIVIFGADVLVRDDTDVGGRNAGRLEGVDGRAGLTLGIVDFAHGFHGSVPVTVARW